MKWRLSFLLLLTGLCALTHCLPRQYHFVGDALPWLDAQTHCRETYTDLATVDNIEEMNLLVNTVQDATGGFTEKAWIGLHDNLTSWRWSLSDERHYGDGEADYRNWDFGQPDNFNGNQHCVRMWSGGIWADSQCSLRSSFVCYNGRTSSTQPFIFVQQERSWSDAQQYCRQQYTDLASVRNQNENQEIQRLANNRSIWIGLYRLREWSDRSESTYRYWKHRQPDNAGGKQNCTASELGNAGRWADERCSKALPFICYGDKKETPDTTTVTPKKITTTLTPNKITTTEIDSTTHHLSTEMTSSDQPSTPEEDQTRTTPADQVIELQLFLTSETQLSEDDIREVSVQFSNRLIELGLPKSIRVGVRRSLAK